MRYIDADALEDVALRLKLTRWDYKLIDRVLFDFPTADVKPVVRGEWKVVDEAEPRRYECSCCHTLSWDNWGNYCPNCGAEMRGE